jgi:hypothetical protein
VDWWKKMGVHEKKGEGKNSAKISIKPFGLPELGQTYPAFNHALVACY